MDGLNFKPFAKEVATNFKNLTDFDFVVRADIDGTELWELYLNSFPEGSNEIFRERTYHDGVYDRNFIRRIGNIVGINKDGHIQTIWNLDEGVNIDYPYRIVAGALHEAVLSATVKGFFWEPEPKVGYEETTERLDSGDSITWNHFYAYIPEHLRNLSEEKREFGTTIEMYLRAKEEFKPYVIQTTKELILDSGLYRGQEYLHVITGFEQLLKEDDGTSTFWYTTLFNSILSARIRNTVIGTLMQDIASGMELDKAVYRYENKMDPMQFKRPRTVVTPRMRERAIKTIEELGISDSLLRRHAKISDIPVTDVLWVSNKTATQMKGTLEDIESKLRGATTVKVQDKIKAVTFDEFLEHIAPNAKAVRLLADNSQTIRLVSVIAPVHEDAPNILKWGNNFSWSYNGEVTDSIVERVKAAGGKTDGLLRVSLSWSNRDDLDLHCFTPGGNHIYYCNKCDILDVDMNVSGESDEPVENMNFKTLVDGTYRFYVDNYFPRSKANTGFTLQVAYNGNVEEYHYKDNDVATRSQVGVAISVKNGLVVKVQALEVSASNADKNVWGITTNRFINIDTIINSPNYWNSTVGNKHVFFISEDVKNEETVRGFYNEFLMSDLDKHRKVFELLGSVMKVDPSDEQVSGFGYSITRGETVVLEVDNGVRTRQFKVTF